MSLRGIRPSLDDYALLEEDPEALDLLIDAYVHDVGFTDVMVEWANDTFLMRTETIPLPPTVGGLEGYDQGQVYRSVTGEPLKLVEHIVENDRPFTELVTADYMLADDILHQVWGVPFDPDGERWQLSYWNDGRPAAGILSSAWMWVRYQSAGNNYQRGRADVVADTLLCSSFNTRDIQVTGEVDLSDEVEVVNAVATNPGCIGCHQSMDPLAGYFWGFKPVIRRSQILRATRDHDCYWPYEDGDALPADFDTDISDFCYPLRQYFPEQENDWQPLGLRDPSYFAEHAEDLVDVGQMIADDPRFSRCMSRRVLAYLMQSEIESIPEDTVSELQLVFEDSGFDVRELAKAAVQTDIFRAAGSTSTDNPDRFARMRPIRPNQFAWTLYDLTGYRWLSGPDPDNCDISYMQGSTCWGTVDLLETDLYGFRSMQGGIDSYYTVRAEHTVSPTKFLTMETVSWDAARAVVESDFATVAPSDRRLLDVIDESETGEAAVRDQIASLYLRMHGATVPANGEDVDLLYAVFADAQTAGARDAWTLVIAALLQDPGMMFL